MNKIIGTILIILACGLGYFGISKVTNSEASVEIVGVELSATDEDRKTTGFIFIGIAVIGLIGGISMLGRKE